MGIEWGRALYKFVIVVMVTICIPLLIGCNAPPTGGKDIEIATSVSLDEFKQVTQGRNQFFFIGTDKNHNYFRAEAGFYKLSSEIPLGSIQFLVKRLVQDKVPIGKFWYHAYFLDGKITGYNGEDAIDPTIWNGPRMPKE